MASAYGWSKQQILNELYPEEVHYYVKRINKHRADRDLTHLAIVHNPHTKEPQKLAQEFEKRIRDNNEGEYWKQEKIDEENYQKLMKAREEMMKNARKKRER